MLICSLPAAMLQWFHCWRFQSLLPASLSNLSATCPRLLPSQFSPIIPSQLGSGSFSLASVWISTLHLLITYILAASIPWGPPCPSGSFSKWLQPVMLKPKPLPNVTPHSCLSFSVSLSLCVTPLGSSPGYVQTGPSILSHPVPWSQPRCHSLTLQLPTLILSCEWRHILITSSLSAGPNFLVHHCFSLENLRLLGSVCHLLICLPCLCPPLSKSLVFIVPVNFQNY